VAARRKSSSSVVLLGTGDDLGVQGRELLRELEILLGEGVRARAVVEVQHAEDPALVDQRNAQRGFDVQAFADDAEVLAIRLSPQSQRPGLGGDLARDALANGDADLRPEFGFDARGHPHPELAGLVVEQHQGSALGPGHVARDLEHAGEQLVGVDRQVVRLDDFVEGLQQLRLVVARVGVVAPEQAGGQRGYDLDAALRGLREAGAEAGLGPCIDHGVERRVGSERGGIVGQLGFEDRGHGGIEGGGACAQLGCAGVDDGGDLDRRIREQQRNQLERLLRCAVDSDLFSHQPQSSSIRGSS
jgi:hypothetical protein